MTNRNTRRLLVALAACGVIAPAAVAAGSAGAARNKQIPQTSCLWTNETSSKLGIGPNFAFPDTGAVYWGSKFTMPAGSSITLNGRFAHARYESLNSYNSTSHSPVDAINDVSTKPDRGSTDPFRVGANRNASKRSYTVTVLNQAAPARRVPNTLYAGVSGQADQELIYRVYVPDTFTRRDATGGVGLPSATLHLADGTVLRGSAACKALGVIPGQLALTTLPKAVYVSLRDQPSKPPTFPAQPTPVFRAFYNVQFLIGCQYQGLCTGHPARTGGQYSNIDNNYVSAAVNRGFAAGPVLVLRGKLPKTAQSGPGVKRMPSAQMRYWSICQNESLYTTRGAGCVYDSQVPVDKHGYYTIVTSLAKDRPADATAKCGVAYIPWPKAGDGAGHLNDGELLLRNMLPSPGFHHAIQNTKTPGDEQAVMGAYYPRGHYTTKAAFQKQHGCTRS